MLPEGITLDMLRDNYRTALTQYQTAHHRARLLDATDRGRLWKAIGAKFPAYQLLPDTNHVSYVKTNLLASLYSVGKSADILPTSEADKDIVARINVLIDHFWNMADVPFYQMQAGERAALLNLGVTQVGWDNELIGGSGDSFYAGMPSLKNIDPLKYVRDPFAESIDTAQYAIIWDDYHNNLIKNNPLYEATYSDSWNGTTTADYETMKDKDTLKGRDYSTVFTHFIKLDGKLYEIHTLNNDHVLAVKEGIEPAILPFAELYCNLANGDLIGTSEPSKIFANSVAYNMMNSIMLTTDYKNQRPPRFINAQAQLDVNSFIKNGNDADYTFVVNGDASRAVHYHQFPQVSAMTGQIMNLLARDMQQVTGVDGSYTGKNTGSILTTGGIEQMLDQATLVDQPKIVNYERYARRMTHLIVSNFIRFGKERKYLVKDKYSKDVKAIGVDFEAIPNDLLLNYALNISSYLPKNKMRIAQMANTLMEKQMQYNANGQQVSWITPEEWLMMQDLPMREFMLERMGIERSQDFIEQVSQTIFQYSELTEQGVPPEDALIATAETLYNKRNGESQPL